MVPIYLRNIFQSRSQAMASFLLLRNLLVHYQQDNGVSSDCPEGCVSLAIPACFPKMP